MKARNKLLLEMIQHMCGNDIVVANRESKGSQPFLDLNNPTIGPFTDKYLKEQYEAWVSFSQTALGELKTISQQQPDAWTAFNLGRPAAGAPAVPSRPRAR